jgi:hypothetical protein
MWIATDTFVGSEPNYIFGIDKDTKMGSERSAPPVPST